MYSGRYGSDLFNDTKKDRRSSQYFLSKFKPSEEEESDLSTFSQNRESSFDEELEEIKKRKQRNRKSRIINPKIEQLEVREGKFGNFEVVDKSNMVNNIQISIIPFGRKIMIQINNGSIHDVQTLQSIHQVDGKPTEIDDVLADIVTISFEDGTRMVIENCTPSIFSIALNRIQSYLMDDTEKEVLGYYNKPQQEDVNRVPEENKKTKRRSFFRRK